MKLSGITSTCTIGICPNSCGGRSLSKLNNPYKETIDRWLSGDKQVRKKQRHTAKRVFDRLRAKWGRVTTFINTCA